ncbi:HEPN domain-containing protein [Desulfonema magnum]|uniref:HEPN domain-containing protein n=1 Tax=Desulfonema magnum TaxID=45655 RepID=A0A975BUE8_9BACT|nr:HEPN domain-containing protein [Desulfonema magnum]QTA91956.1 HEPN domain-containing protein [Desulfonema magnum]
MSFTDFIEKARQNLAVAEWCHENGHYDACCNRAYYAMYHAAIAVLASKHITPSQTHIDHGWVQTQFVTHFCNRNKIFPKFRTYLQDAQKIRDLADYRPESLNRNKAKRQLGRAGEFVQAILRRLRSHDEL